MVRLPNDPTRHEYRSPIFRRRARAALPTFLLLAAAALADHGPGTTGGGLNVVSGETLKQGKLSFDLRYDYTSFEPLTTSEIAAKAKKGREFDFLDSSLLGAVTASYGLSDDVQVNFTIGSYRARGAGAPSSTARRAPSTSPPSIRMASRIVGLRASGAACAAPSAASPSTEARSSRPESGMSRIAPASRSSSPPPRARAPSTRCLGSGIRSGSRSG